MSLPIIDGVEEKQGRSFLPKRRKEVSSDSSSEEEKPPPTIGGGFAVLRGFLGSSSSEGEDEASKEEQSPLIHEAPNPPGYMRKVAWAWERRALRAEESLRDYQEGLVNRKGDGKLKKTLTVLLNEDSGIMDERNLGRGSKSTWNARAFSTMEDDEWLVIKVPQANRSHVMVDFCDGDQIDDKHWLEGPFSQSLTLRELIEYQQGSNRVRRRACTDNLLRKAHWRGPKWRGPGQEVVENLTTTSSSPSTESPSNVKNGKVRRALM